MGDEGPSGADIPLTERGAPMDATRTWTLLTAATILTYGYPLGSTRWSARRNRGESSRAAGQDRRMSDRPTLGVVDGGGAAPSTDDVEAQAFMRIANAIAAELPSIGSPHWRRACCELREGLSETASRRCALAPSVAASR